MIRKIFFYFLCFSSIVLNAQINSVSYPSETLTEESIAQYLENSRKSGVKEWEVQKASEILHQRMQKQANTSANNFQRTITPPPHVNSSGCTNPGFENGTTSNWTLLSGNINSINLPCNTCANNLGAVTHVVSSTSSISGQCSSGIDQYGNFPVVAPSPLGGNYSLLLNNANSGGKIEKAQYVFVVDAGSTSFTYQYAMVLESGGHPANEQPYFAIDVTDITTGSSFPCAQYNVNPPLSGNLPGWYISTVNNTVYYKPWETVLLDFSSIIGDTVSINFIVSDCNQGGHFGYAYIDASCSPNQINVSNPLCMGGSTLLQGIPGMASYNWAGPITGTEQNLVTNTPGSYTLTTASGTSCPASNFYYSLTQSGASSPTISINPVNDTICFGVQNILTPSGANTYLWLPGGQTTNTLSVIASPTVTASYSTYTYSVMGTDSVTSCANIATATVTVKGNTLQIANNADTICAGGSVIITANGASTYTWSPAAGLSSINSASVIATPTINTTYTVNGNSNGCMGIATASVTIVQQPTVTVTQNSVLCFGSCNGSALASSTASNNTYSWTPGGATTQSINSLCPGNYTVQVSNHYCSAVNTKTITVTSPTQLTQSTTFTNSTCSSGNGSISITALGGTSPYTYQLNTGSYFTSNIFNTLSIGTYTVNTKDNNGCIATSMVTISQGTINNPTVTINAANSTCTSGNGSVTVTGAGGTSPYTYELNAGTYTTSSTFTGLVAATYTVHLKDVTGCIETSTVAITQAAVNNPTVTATSSTICAGTTTTLTAGGASTYTWNTGATGSTFTATPSVLTDYTVTGTDVNNCKALATSTVTVNSVPAVVITPTQTTICNGSSDVLTASGANTYTWSTSATTASISVTPTITTTYTLIGENTTTGCVNHTTKTISVSNCSQNCVTISANGTWTVPANICSTATVYVWGGGGGSGGGVSNSSDNASGGGGGGACTFNTLTVTAGQVYTITIGAGGAAGSSAGTAGANGGTSTFTGAGGTLTAGGGFGGSGVTSTTVSSVGTGGAGATTGTGGTTFAGGNGSSGVATTASEVGGAGGGAGGSGGIGGIGTSGNASATSNSVGGAGGAGIEMGGAGASAVYTTASLAGVAGSIPGGGAAGEANYTTSEFGAIGGVGQVIICYTTPATIIANAAPTTQTVCTNATATTVSITATGGGLIYQWYSNTVNSNTGGTIIAGATANSYIPPTSLAGTKYYYCAISGACSSSATSAVAQVLVTTCSTTTICPASMALTGVDSLTSNTLTSGFNTFCNNKAFYIKANEPTTLTDSINDDYTPCIEVLFHTYQSTLATNASLNVYQAAVNLGCVGPSCPFNIGGSAGTVGSNWELIVGYLDYTKPHSFVFSTTAAIPTTTVTLKSCQTNQIYNTFVWSASGVSSSTVTIPATANIGKATFSITPAVSANALTDFHDGECKIRPSLLSLGTYTVTYTFSDTVCAGTSTNYIFNVTKPNVIWTTLPSLCVGGACVSLTNQLNTLAEPGGTWSGTGVSSNLYCPSTVGTNTVTYTAGTGTCSASQTHSVTVNALPVISVNSATVCAGSLATLTASGASTYTWNTGATGISISPSPTVNTTYTVTGTNANNCSSKNTSTVTVNPAPNITINANPNTICMGATATLTASGATTYIWNTSSTNASIIVSPTITTDYTVTSTNNCSKSVTITLTVNPLPTIIVNSDTVCLGDSTMLTAHGATTYTWMPSTYLSNTNSASVITKPTTSITYTVVGSDTNICKNYNTSLVTVLDSNSTFCKTAVSTIININNAFSPNGDGLNETFIIDNIEENPKNHVYIYNRWGQLLWNKANYDNNLVVWDGKTQDGVVLYSGTYFYLIEIEGQKNLKGWVELTK